jgi:catechol 2,3-dioxygenase-like lactoylglutathione lyase family enzyme
MDFTNAPFVGNLPAADINRAIAWYDEKLGLKPVMDLQFSGQLYRTGGVSWLLYQTPSAGTGKHTLGSFVVSDIDATMAELKAKGVVFEDYDMGDEGPTTQDGVSRGEGGGAAAWFKDSEDNVLSITQLPAGMSL